MIPMILMEDASLIAHQGAYYERQDNIRPNCSAPWITTVEALPTATYPQTFSAPTGDATGNLPSFPFSSNVTLVVQTIPNTVPAAPLSDISAAVRRADLERAINEAEREAEDEGIVIKADLWNYAKLWFGVTVRAFDIPIPLMLATQDGGLSAEWHDVGMNIEVRFRRPDYIYTLVEDALGIHTPVSGNDVSLLSATSALRIVSERLKDRR